MVGKPVPPKPMPPKTTPTPDSIPREAGTYAIASPPVIPGAASAAAGAALQAAGRTKSPGSQGASSRLPPKYRVGWCHWMLFAALS